MPLFAAAHRETIQTPFWATDHNAIAIPLAGAVFAPICFVPPPAMGDAMMSLSTVIGAITAVTPRCLDFRAATSASSGQPGGSLVPRDGTRCARLFLSHDRR